MTSTRDREKLYDAEAAKASAAGRGARPICRLCDLPIQPGQAWDVNHEAHKPRWLGGAIDGISHRRCNRRHNNDIDTPLFAKSNRIRRAYIGATVSRRPLPGGRYDRIKKRVDGVVVLRATGEPVFKAKGR